MTRPELEAIIELAVNGTPQTVSAAAIRDVFAAVDLRHCHVEVDGDSVTISSRLKLSGELTEVSRAAEMAIVAAQLTP